jgi:uncharacterized membrane protein YfcA
MPSSLADLTAIAEPGALAALALIYLASSIFSGLSGFGFSAIGCLSLLVLPPQRGIATLMALSLATQVSSLRSLWPQLRHHALPWSRLDGVLPYLAGGTLGMPAGLAILAALGARELSVGLGLLLIAYSAWSLHFSGSARLQGVAPARWRSFLVGAAGGVVGGFSAFPGSALVVWNGLRGAGKEEGRALTQPYILWMQVVGVALFVVTRPRLFDASFWAVLGAALPAALLGNLLGVAIYRKTGDLGYRRITLGALGLSGSGLILKVMLA